MQLMRKIVSREFCWNILYIRRIEKLHPYRKSMGQTAIPFPMNPVLLLRGIVRIRRCGEVWLEKFCCK